MSRHARQLKDIGSITNNVVYYELFDFKSIETLYLFLFGLEKQNLSLHPYNKKQQQQQYLS